MKIREFEVVVLEDGETVRSLPVIHLASAPLVFFAERAMKQAGYKLAPDQRAVAYARTGYTFPLYDIRESVQCPGHKAHVRRIKAAAGAASVHNGRLPTAAGLDELRTFLQRTSQSYRRPYIEALRRASPA